MQKDDWKTLHHKLQENVAGERKQIVHFLQDLDRFDEERGWQQAAFTSLWTYCLDSLRLRESSAGRRIAAMKLLRRFPQVAGPLGDGRLSLSTLCSLGRVLTEENVDELVARAAYLSERETDVLVVTIRPVTPPRDGIRKLPESVARAAQGPEPEPDGIPSSPLPASRGEGSGVRGSAGSDTVSPVRPSLALALQQPAVPTPSRPTLEPVSADRWSMRVTLSTGQKEDLETLRALLSHKVPDGDLSSVLHEAIRCAIEKHGKRRGAVRPERTRNVRPPKPRPAGERQPVSLEVIREVWERDGGRCTYVSSDGRRCDSRWQLELDHVDSARIGGPTTAKDLRLRCRPHNIFHAEQTFGRTFMAKFRRAGRPTSPRVDSTPGAGSAPDPKEQPASRPGVP